MRMYTQLHSTRVSRFLSIVIIFFFFFFFFFSALSSTGIAVNDFEADYMSKLLKALTPTPPGWSQNTHFCQWNGVNCSQPPSGDGNRVNAILLPSSSLGGELPQDLNGLLYLTHLDLHNNSLSGAIPSLADLSFLETVYLGHNNFTSIPYGCFQGLTALQTLNLSNNSDLTKWYFPTELAQSQSLRTFELAATNVAGELPAGIFDWFPSLQSVDLSSNSIGGSLPESLGRSRIRQLRLSDNYLTGPIPDLSNCTDLSDLQLRLNLLTGLVPPSLMALPSLQNVSLDDNFLQGPIPVFSRKDVKATWGKTNRFCRYDPGPCDPRVTTLLQIAAAFGYPTNLSWSWTGNDPCDKGKIWDYIECEEAKIITVNLTNMNFSGTISPAFANLTSLQKLTLSGNNLTGTIPQSLTSLSQLELLDLSNNDLFGEIPNFSPKVKLNTKGNVNLVGFSRGAGDASPPVSGHRAILRHVLIAVASVSGVGGVVILVVIISKRKRYFSLVQERIFRKGRKFDDHNLEAFMQSYNLSVPKRYSYAEVKRITNSFCDKLGQGGYGVVYKASLPDGRHVAVKVINESKGNGEEFINEVASISRTSHVNIVSLLGFCYEMNKRALIYEFMPNGSLDQFIYSGGFPSAICNLDWNTLFQIAIGIARGLEYLHQGCTSRILHLDIKPQNILLDEDFCPKISDFGLAKICQKKESIVSILGTRGTIGYIAPEVFSRTYGGVSHRSDVYSYGMLIVEMIGGIKNHDSGGSQSTEMYFPDWIYRDLEQDHAPVNCLAMSEEENDMVRKITMVSLWCIQMNPSDRPSMSKVIEMLQGPLQSVPYPPKPALYSPERPSLQISYVSSSNLSETHSTSLLENGSLKSIQQT